MRYYIDTIEQLKDGTEYGKREIQSAEKTFEEVLSAYYIKLGNVANDLGADGNHTYMDIRIVDSTGGVLKKDGVGAYVQ